MPRKGYKPSGYRIKRPDEDTFLGQHKPTGARLYASLAGCQLYVNARLIGDIGLGNRRSFYFGWIIEEQRWANQGDRFKMPAAILDWAASLIQPIHPSLEEATGLTRAEIIDLIDEQKRKRAAYDN